MFTRDSLLFWVLLATAIVGYLIGVGTSPLTWTYMEWLQAASFVLGVAAAKLQNSPLPSKQEVRMGLRKAVGPFKPPKPIMVVLVAATLVAAGACRSASELHTATVSSSGVYAAIATIDDAERALWQAGQAGCNQAAAQPCLTKEQHDALAPKILTLLKAGKAANDAVIAVGRIPPEINATVDALAAVAKDVANLLPDGAARSKLQTAIISAQAAVNLLLTFRSSQAGGGLLPVEVQ